MFFIKDLKFYLGVAMAWFMSFYFDVYCCFARLFGFKEKGVQLIPERLYFEVTNVCNARCRFCVYSKKTPKKYGVMSFEVFKKAIDEFVSLGGEVVSFTPTIGEPLLDPGLLGKVKYASALPKIKKFIFILMESFWVRTRIIKS
jgi:sulfatase maturation enzyme AslB (radical SAM superfamily)